MKNIPLADCSHVSGGIANNCDVQSLEEVTVGDVKEILGHVKGILEMIRDIIHGKDNKPSVNPSPSPTQQTTNI